MNSNLSALRFSYCPRIRMCHDCAVNNKINSVFGRSLRIDAYIGRMHALAKLNALMTYRKLRNIYQLYYTSVNTSIKSVL